MRRHLPLPILFMLLLAGCGKFGADASTQAGRQDEDAAARAASASDRARASEAQAERLEAEVSQLAAQSGASNDLGNGGAPPVAEHRQQARGAVRAPVVIASRTTVIDSRPVATRSIAKKAPKPAPSRTLAPESSISAGELQRQLAPSGLLRPQPDQPKLDYNAEP